MNFSTVSQLSEFIQNINFEGIGMFFNYLQVFIFGILALFLSILSVSGTWVILVSMIIFKFYDPYDSIGWFTVGVFAFVCIFVEIAEFFSVKYGIKRAKGTKDSEVIGMISGIIGAIIGEILIPIPFLGAILGMFTLSYIAVYVSEYHFHKIGDKAAVVAWAGIAAKAFMIIFKLLVTVAMLVVYIYLIFKN